VTTRPAICCRSHAESASLLRGRLMLAISSHEASNEGTGTRTCISQARQLRMSEDLARRRDCCRSVWLHQRCGVIPCISRYQCYLANHIRSMNPGGSLVLMPAAPCLPLGLGLAKLADARARISLSRSAGPSKVPQNSHGCGPPVSTRLAHPPSTMTGVVGHTSSGDDWIAEDRQSSLIAFSSPTLKSMKEIATHVLVLLCRVS
jgi:hypothetical protein